ncbi:MAG: phage baseplate assembly protein V [Acidobacteriota bacterium]
MTAQTPYYGKYRGVVTDNADPNNLGRLRAKVPDVLGDRESGWAMPSVPYAGKQVGLFLLPESNTSIWIEFEHGDPDYPIWSGCFWASGEVPVSPASADKKVLKTAASTITLDDTKGSSSVTIETTNNLKIKMDQQGIEISNGSQKIVVSTTSVSVDDGALEVS